MIRHALLATSLLCGGLISTATAQPTDKAGDKGSAKALMQSGLKLFAAKDYLGALAVFRDAYDRFPSGKILLNIGTTLLKLDRPAEAANAYQRYLDSPDADASKKDETTRVLADLDKKVGVVELAIEPADAEVQLDSEAWRPASEVKRVRAMPGPLTIRVRRQTYKDLESTATMRPGATTALSLRLELAPVATTTTTTGGTATAGASIAKKFEPPAKRSRFGALALAHIDPAAPGVAGVVGMVVDITDHLGARAAAIVGPRFGGYVGVSYSMFTSFIRPIVAVAMPVFASDGVRWSIRGAGGVEVAFNRNLSVIAEVGVEHLFNPEDSVESSTLFVPAVGVSGRL